MIKVIPLDAQNMGLAFSCTKDNNLWGSQEHQIANKFIIDNLNYPIYAFGILYGNESIGHAILIGTKLPLSTIESESAVFIHCIYISQKYRNQNFGATLLLALEKEIVKKGKSALFVQSIGMRWMSKDFFIKNGYSVINEDELDYTLIKKLSPKVEYSLSKDFILKTTKTNELAIYHNPFCPMILHQYREIASKARSALPEIEVTEHYPGNIAKKSDFSFGIYFNNTPILTNPKKVDESIAFIKSLRIKI